MRFILFLLVVRLISAVSLGRRQSIHNNFSCHSAQHSNPVVLLHGLGATYYEDLNLLGLFLQQSGFCTFSITYGAYPEFPLAGGLTPISQSAPEIANFVREVHEKTGAAYIDLIGHSEGGFQALYVPKFEGIDRIVENIIAIAPPTHGTTFAGLYNLTYVDGDITRQLAGEILETVGCGACNDLGTDGPAVQALNSGLIVQEGNKVTILTSRYDELVTPTTTSFVYESGVRNLYVQDFCPADLVGHIGEAYDANVWAIVLQTLNGEGSGPILCDTVSVGA